MRIRVRISTLGFVFLCLAVTSGYAQQNPDPNATSLGNVARELNAQKAKKPKPAKVFTNDNIPATEQMSGVSPSSPEKTSASPSTPAKGSGQPAGAHDKEYFLSHMTTLEGNLDTHKRELDVLEEKLGQNQMQYYPDPNKTLHQEYSRGDIDKLDAEIDAKKQQVADDEKAIEDLHDELRHEGGDSSWLP